MKKAILKFAQSLISRDQMKVIKGGVVYCVCNGSFVGLPDLPGDPNNWNCAYRCEHG